MYDANKLSDLVDEKKKMQNWLVYYQLKYERNESKRPLIKTGCLGIWGEHVDAIDFYNSEIIRHSKECHPFGKTGLLFIPWIQMFFRLFIEGHITGWGCVIHSRKMVPSGQ